MAATDLAIVTEHIQNMPAETASIAEPVEEAEMEQNLTVPRAKKPTLARDRPPHPTYKQMIKAAIESLKERTGSSSYAIARYLEEKYESSLPSNFKKILSIQLRNLSTDGKLVKVKNSFKLADELKKVPRVPVKRVKATGPAKEVKKTAGRPKTVSKSKAVKRVASPKVATKGTTVKPTKVSKPGVKPSSTAKANAKEKVTVAPTKPPKRKAPLVRTTEKATTPRKTAKSVKRLKSSTPTNSTKARGSGTATRSSKKARK